MTRYERWLLWTSSALVGLTGVVYAWMKYVLRGDDPYAVVHHPLQPLVLKLHILAAPCLVFALGVVFTRHVVRQWSAGGSDGRTSGFGIVATVVPMVISGYLLQALSSESWLFRVAMLHVGASLLYLSGLGVHQIAAWRAARRRAARPSALSSRVS